MDAALLDDVPTLADIDAELARRSFRDYLPWVWPIIEPATIFVPNWHLDAICEHLEAIYRGDLRNLLILMPPRMGKSFTASIAFPTWAWTQQPALRFLFASYSDELSTEHAVKSRRVLDSEPYRAAFGHLFRLTSDQNIKTHYENDKTGYRISTSVGGTGTGRGGDILICDDPHNLKQIHSELVRNDVREWYRTVWRTRLNDQRTGKRVVIMQRGHEADVAGDCLASGEYAKLELPNEYVPTTYVTPIGWRDPRTIEGELLCPARIGAKETAALKSPHDGLGSWAYATQFQQQPAPSDGNVFKRQWFRFWKELPGDLDYWALSADCAFKDLQTSDYVAIGVWAVRGAQKFLVCRLNERLDFVGTCQALRGLCAKYPQIEFKWVEDKANGSAVISALKQEIPSLIGVNPEGGKEARAWAVQATVEAGNVYLPDPSVDPTIEDFIRQCCLFPNGTHDDEVDQMTQALRRIARREARKVEPLSAEEAMPQNGNGTAHATNGNGNGNGKMPDFMQDGMYWPGE